jgi:hypothetical protein
METVIGKSNPGIAVAASSPDRNCTYRVHVRLNTLRAIRRGAFFFLIIAIDKSQEGRWVSIEIKQRWRVFAPSAASVETDV